MWQIKAFENAIRLKTFSRCYQQCSFIIIVLWSSGNCTAVICNENEDSTHCSEAGQQLDLLPWIVQVQQNKSSHGKQNLNLRSSQRLQGYFLTRDFVGNKETSLLCKLILWPPIALAFQEWHLYFPYKELYTSLVGEVLLVYGMCRNSYWQLSLRQLGVHGIKEVFLKRKEASLMLGH